MSLRYTLSIVVLLCATLTVIADGDVGHHGYRAPPRHYDVCGQTCRFTFCGDYHDGNNYFIVGKFNDKAFTPAICDKRGKIIVGTVDETGEAYVVDKYYKIPISKYSPKDLEQHFSPSFFKAYALDYVQRSGVGHEKPQANQVYFLDGKCIVLPLKSFQILDKSGVVIEEVHPSGSPFYDCVAFKTKVFKGYTV